MKIAIAQQNYTVGDIDGNSQKIIDAIERAKSEGADVVLFAEQAISGVGAYDLLRKTTFLEVCEDALHAIASHCIGITAIVGVPTLSQKGTMSSAAVCANGQVATIINKHHITARREMGFLVGGHGSQVVEIAGKKCLVVVGDDIRRLRKVDHAADIIISINARKYAKGVLSIRYSVLKSLSSLKRKLVVIVNQVGGNSEIVYDGTSGVFNECGDLMLYMKSFEEDFQIYDSSMDCGGLTAPPLITYNDRMPLMYKAAVLGLRDYFHKNGYDKACLSLSGGIDSSVGAVLAVEALGAQNVKAFIMPSDNTISHSVGDAVEFAQKLGIEYNVIPIMESYNSIISSMGGVIQSSEFDVASENIQSRIRTILLMALQNRRGNVLLNTSNKTENALGMCTLYGDTAGAFCVTGDLYKSEVYDLARYINKISNDIIPDKILEKEPTSELHPEKLEETPLPPYEVVDAILYRMIELEQHREEIINAGFEAVDVNTIHSMVLNNVKKRVQYPPILRLSTCSFRHERLMPLTNKYGI